MVTRRLLTAVAFTAAGALILGPVVVLAWGAWVLVRHADEIGVE